MNSGVIRFYFDYESPNAYIAWLKLPELARKYGFTVEPLPILYAALLDANGQIGPGEQPTKGRWMRKNFLRKAALLKIPLNPPAFMPFNPLLALRVSLLPLEDKMRRALITALFEAVWVRSLHVSETDVVARLLDELGVDGRTLVARAQTPEVKAELRRRTDDAIARGVFGVPSMEVAGELFWGYDDFPYLELFLAGKDPLPERDSPRWSALRPSSMRRQFRTGLERR